MRSIIFYFVLNTNGDDMFIFVPRGTETRENPWVNLPKCAEVVPRLMLFKAFLAIYG